jgi:hypothetical protein
MWQQRQRCGWVEQLGRARRVQWAEPGSGAEGVFSLFFICFFLFLSQVEDFYSNLNFYFDFDFKYKTQI